MNSPGPFHSPTSPFKRWIKKYWPIVVTIGGVVFGLVVFANGILDAINKASTAIGVLVPTATLIPTVSPTPIPPIPTEASICDSFQSPPEDGIRVLVTNFSGELGNETMLRIYSSLGIGVRDSNLTQVQVNILESVQPQSSQDAVAIGTECGATLVIWGIADEHGINPYYDVVQNAEQMKIRPSLPSTRFKDLIVETIPEEYEYVMLFSLGQMAFLRGDFSSAVDLLTQALAKSNESIKHASQIAGIDVIEHKANLNVAGVYYYRGLARSGPILQGSENSDVDLSYSLALKDFTSAIEENPELIEAYIARGGLNNDLTNYTDAHKDFEIAIEKDTSHEYLNVYLWNGNIYAYQEDYDSAIANYNQAVRYARGVNDYVEAYALNARAYINAKRGTNLEAARADINRAIYLQPDEAYIWDSRAFIRYKLGELEPASKDAIYAIEHGEYYSYYTLGLIYEAMDRIKEAISNYKLFIEKYEDDVSEKSDAAERIRILSQKMP